MTTVRYCKTYESAKRALSPLRHFLENPDKKYRVGVDIETFTVTGENATDVFKSNIRTIQLFWGEELIVLDGLYVDLKRFKVLKNMLTAKHVLKIGHNLKFEWKFFKHHMGVEMAGIWDTMLAEQITLNGSKSYGFGLKDLLEDHFGVKMDKTIREEDWSIPELEPHKIKYAARDVKYLLDLQSRQRQAMTSRDKDIAELEFETMPLLAQMELTGVKINESKIESIRQKYEDKIADLLGKLQKELPWVPVGKSKWKAKWVRLQYPDGVKPVGSGFRDERFVKDAKNDIKKAMEVLGVPLPMVYNKTTKKYAPSLTIDTVDSLQHELAPVMKEYFEQAAIYNKYLTKMHSWVNTVTNRVHCDIRQLKVTGRLSKGEPPLQQMPKESWFRSLFIVDEGRSLVKADYSQLELRLTAEVSMDNGLISEYAKGLEADVHTKTAIQIFCGGDKQAWMKLDNDKKKELRYGAKAVNFGTIYGQGATGLKQYLVGYGLYWTVEECQHAINAWFALYQRVRKYHSRIRKSALGAFRIKKSGYGKDTTYSAVCSAAPGTAFALHTLGGRKRLWDYKTLLDLKKVGINYNRKTKDPYLYCIATEMYNLPVQGTAADGIKMAMVRLAPLLKKYDARILLQVHDELVLDCPREYARVVGQLTRKIMEQEMQKLVRSVPIYVDVSIGPDWGATVELPRREGDIGYWKEAA